MVTAVDYPTGTDPTITWDAESHFTQFVDANGTTSRTFDDAGRITNESFGGSPVCAYSYDAVGKKGLLSSITDESARRVTYAYTDRRQLSSVGDSAGTASYSYDPDGPLCANMK